MKCKYEGMQRGDAHPAVLLFLGWDFGGTVKELFTDDVLKLDSQEDFLAMARRNRKGQS